MSQYKKQYKKRYKKSLFQRIGFFHTLDILDGQNKMSLREFYDAMNEISYYNAFFRVKDEMVSCGLIKLTKAKKRYIELTKEGKRIKDLVDELKKIEE